jgi:hypothetical protein
MSKNEIERKNLKIIKKTKSSQHELTWLTHNLWREIEIKKYFFFRMRPRKKNTKVKSVKES